MLSVVEILLPELLLAMLVRVLRKKESLFVLYLKSLEAD
jgi:hypothetical protein